MLTATDRRTKWKGIEGVYRQRQDNMRLLKRLHGDSWEELGRATGRSASYLCQIAGPNPVRMMTEVLARQLEDKLKFAPGWFDQAH